ncbi:MAG: YqgE/AlgH family protein [Gammaproteobacteria bacterium]|nr:YqgE/AlgH family protein [Gammaproteobacteria bacterium]MCK5262774.1 YqgE/AlgH family protein [Gammaproteobacteria bacterium]
MKTTNLTNHFIIAMPSLLDDNFNQTVTYICEHNENGCFGIVINRKTDVTLDEVIHQMEIEVSGSIIHDTFIYHGGPVQQERGFILHQPLGEWSSSLKINDHLALTTSRDILEAIAHDEGPEQSIIALGYAGWSPGQLEQEMAANTWLNCPAEEQIIFDTPAEKRWQSAADLLGVDLQLLSNDAGHA